jgi:hypothetical protein
MNRETVFLLAVIVTGVAGCSSGKPGAGAAQDTTQATATVDAGAAVAAAPGTASAVAPSAPPAPTVPPPPADPASPASLEACQVACTNDEEVGCKATLAGVTDAKKKSRLQTTCNSHEARDACILICVKSWKTADATCVTAAKAPGELDQCLPIGKRRLAKEKEGGGK